MRRAVRIFLAVSALLCLAAAGSVVFLRSAWLRERIRSEAVAQIERATGGKVELGGFRFDWRARTIHITGLTLHGTENSGPPLLSIERASAELQIISYFTRDLRIGRTMVESPRSHLTVTASGVTNLPRPRVPLSGKAAADTIVDLRIASLDVRNGSVLLEVEGRPPRTVPWDASANEVAARVRYEANRDRYTGEVSARTGVRVRGRTYDLAVAAGGSLERNRIAARSVKLSTAQSEIEITNATLENFASPVAQGSFSARLLLAEFDKRASGILNAAGEARWVSMDDYRVTGRADSANVSLPRIRNVRLSSGFALSPGKLEFRQARLAAAGGRMVADGEFTDWSKFKAKGILESFDLARAAELAGAPPPPYQGVLSGPFEAAGTPARQSVSAQLTVAPASSGTPLRGQLDLRYDSVAGRLDLGHSWMELPGTRVDVSGTLGEQLEVRATSTNSEELRAAAAGRAPDISFTSAAFNGRVTGPLGDPLVSGHVTATGVGFDQVRLASLSAQVEANAGLFSSSEAIVESDGMRIRLSGTVPLADWSISQRTPVRAAAEMEGADVSAIPQVRKTNLSLKGLLAVRAEVSGTLGAPVVSADVLLGKGSIEGQPFDSVSGKLQWTSRSQQTFSGLFISGPKRVNISSSLANGTDLEFNLTSNTMPLNEVALVRLRQPDIQGFGKFHADGLLKLSTDSRGGLHADLGRINADASANGLELTGRNLGDARFTAQTTNGIAAVRFESNAARASIRGDGTVRLGGDYPASAKVQFTETDLNPLVALILKSEEARALNFDGTAQATLAIAGPLLKPDEMTAAFDIPRIELHPLPGTGIARVLPGFSVSNNGPIRISMAKSILKVESARLKGPETDVTVSGIISPLANGSQLDLRLRGDLNLTVLHSLSPDLSSSGLITLDATLRGGFASPAFSGRAVLRNGDFHYAEFSNGLSDANGEITFSGTRANIQSLSAESGGGKVTATGFASWTNEMLAFRVEARAHEVRVRYPEGVSSVSDAAITVAGTQLRSQVSGTVTIHRIAVNPKSDAATILQMTAQPLKVAPQGGLLANMNLDVQVSTAPDVAIQTAVTKSVSADASLRLRGTATNPAVLGRVNITQGEVVFFGNKYDINQGSISFFNPTKIEPVLNLDLETKARGVDVILTVAGPMSKLNMSYRSDPPLQFSDIVALLATGRTPVDPTLSGHAQGYQQLGASELVGQAIANPVAGRLQRFFGVSRLKIDPQLTGLTGSPQARLTIEQQVTPEILFTYITDVSSTSAQLFRVEWAFNKNWSAILTRQESGYVGVDFAYKKRFK